MSNAALAIPAVDPDLHALTSLPKSQLRAALAMLADLAANARAVPDGRYVIERCAGYWCPSGSIPRAVAQLVFPFVYDLVRAKQISTKHAMTLDYTPRVVKEGQRRGFHWLIARAEVERAGDLVEALEGLGYVVERRTSRLGDPVLYQTTGRGKRTWMICPEHDDHAPSALVNPSGVVYCFGCARVVGMAEAANGGVMYRPVLRAAPAPATLPPAQPPRVETRPEVSAAPLPPARGPYSPELAAEAGSPGLPPRMNPLAKPTGILILLHGEMAQVCRVEPMKIGFVLGRRFGDEGVTRKGRRGLARSYSSCRDLLDVLRSAQRRDAGPGAWGRGLDAFARHERSGLRDHRGFLPDLYVSLDHHEHASVRTIQINEDTTVLQPDGFTARCGRWVGVDLDGFASAPASDKGLVAAAETIRGMLERHPCFTGRMGLVRTSDRGVQVVAELAETRWDLDGFYRDPHVQRMLAGLDRVSLDAVRAAGFEGGHADTTVHAPGRLVRRPGPRRTKSGTVFVARLVYATP